MELRVIRFYDCDTDFLVKTDAPDTLIDRAIERRDYCLENDIDMGSDFETIQDFVSKNGYIFERVGYVQDLESYNW